MTRAIGTDLVYRAPMRSRLDDIDPGAAPERGLRLGLCGIGGRLEQPPTSLDEAIDWTGSLYGARAAARLERFAAVPAGATVWTRDADGDYRRGTLTGPWTYDSSGAAHDVDLVHVRACDWGPGTEVPSAVLAAFARGGRNFQRIRRA